MSTVADICHITSLHQRFDSRIFHKECRSLVRVYGSVALVVCDGLGDERVEGVQVLDAGVRPRRRLAAMLLGPWRAFRRARRLRARLYHFHDPEFLLFGLLLKLMGHRVVFDIHENLPLDIRGKAWVPALIRPGVALSYGWLEDFLVRFFDGVCVPQPTMEAHFLGHARRTALVANFTPVEQVLPVDPAVERCDLFHAGALTVNRGLFNMLDAMVQVKEGPVLHLAGRFESEAVRRRAEAHPAWGRVCYHGMLSQAEVYRLYQRCGLGLILYQPVGQYHLGYAIKLFEYMAHRMPVLLPDFGEWVDFGRDYGCALNVAVDDARAVAEGVNTLLSDKDAYRRMAENGQRAFRAHFSWRVAEAELLGLYRNLLNDGGEQGDAA